MPEHHSTRRTGRYGHQAFLLLSLLAYLLNAILAPKSFRSSAWPSNIDRQSVISRGREVLALLHIDQSLPLVSVSSRYLRDDELVRYRLLPQSPLLQFFSPVTFNLRFDDRLNSRSISIETTLDGLPRRFSLLPYHRSGIASSSPGEISSDLEDSRLDEASAVLSVLYPFFSPSFFTLSDASHSREQSRVRYRIGAEEGPVRPAIEMTMQGGRLSRLEFMPGFDREFREAAEERSSGWSERLKGVTLIYGWVLILLGGVCLLAALVLGRLQAGLTMRFWVLSSLVLVFFSLTGGFGEGLRLNLRYEFDGAGPHLQVLLALLVWMIVMTGIGLVAWAIYASGRAMEMASAERRSIGLDLLLKGRVLTREVIGAAFAGLGAGGIVALVPRLIAGSGLFGEVETGLAETGADLVSRMPAISTTINFSQLIFLAHFGLLAPLLISRISRRGLVRGILLILTVVVAGGVSPIIWPDAAILVSSVMAACVLVFTYLRRGLLAIIVALLASETATSAAFLFSLSSPSLKRSGLLTLAGLAALLILSFTARLRVVSANPVETAIPASVLETRAERDRLTAEFEVARLAQQRLLPEVPPATARIDIAAHCVPSREVGGDLYDFINFSDGRIGVIVADVSGKGVSASLYMALTKGLIDSVAGQLSDPGEILRSVNAHLYPICQRRVFVTLFLGIIDPSRLTLTYARAGHNPPALRRACNRGIEWLDSRGIGLGLTSHILFNHSITVSSIQLTPGDVLLCYSDGITEAANGTVDGFPVEFGEDRLASSLSASPDLSASAVLDHLLHDHALFLGDIPAQDDKTLVVVRIS